jgi:hypothetical protein
MCVMNPPYLLAVRLLPSGYVLGLLFSIFGLLASWTEI